MPRRPDLVCAGCRKLIWRGRASLPEGQAMCRECRRARHGYGSYKRGCRCDVCVAANRARRLSVAQKCSSCDLPALARGMCSTHYSYWYRREVSGVWRAGGWIDRAVRNSIYERDGWTCHLCGEAVDRTADPVRDNRAPSLDHLVPVSRGGGNAESNLATAHRGCNSARGAQPIGAA